MAFFVPTSIYNKINIVLNTSIRKYLDNGTYLQRTFPCMSKIKLFSIAFCLCVFSFGYSQNTYTISGHIQDITSAEKLISANIYIANTYEGTVTNVFGFYSITLPAGQQELNVSFIGYEPQVLNLDLQKDTSITINLKPKAALKEIEIVAKAQKNIAEESQMSTMEIPIAQIKKLPAFLGETDVLKALQLLPGVQSGGEGQSGLYVRGGSPDQNLILLDGTPVYNVSHLFGFFSVFNSDVIKDVKLIKGGYPARYGGRLSSVLDINMKEGNMKEIHGAGSIGIVASKLTIEGPIIKDKTSFILSGRRTYIDILARPIFQKEFEENGEEGSTGYYFYDVNAKVNHKIGDKDRIYASFYAGDDRFYFNVKETDTANRDFTESNIGWGNVTSALRWNHIWQPKLFSNFTFTYSNYDLDTKVGYGTEDIIDNTLEEISIGYLSGINDLAAKIDFDWVPNPSHYVKFGISGIHHKFRPGKFELKQIEEDIDFEQTLGQADVSTQEIDLYIEDDYKINDKIKINAGLHASSFVVQGKSYHSLQPRLSGRYLLSDGSSLKTSFATMRQYVHLLAFEGIGLPTDLWLPTTEKIKPQDSWQVALGYAFKISKNYDLTIEGYYRGMSNLVSYKEGSGLFELNDWQDRITQGNGTSKGIELFLQKKTGRLSGWLGYTLSYTDRQFDDLNFGETFPYKYDRRHDISIVAIYEVGPKINVSATWVYGTGNAITLSNSQYTTFHPSSLINERLWAVDAEDILSRNNYRMKSYHRGDISINFVKQKKRYKRTWSIGAYNVYNNKNPFFLTSGTKSSFDSNGNEEKQFVLRQQSLFPIIPFINYSFEF